MGFCSSTVQSTVTPLSTVPCTVPLRGVSLYSAPCWSNNLLYAITSLFTFDTRGNISVDTVFSAIFSPNLSSVPWSIKATPSGDSVDDVARSCSIFERIAMICETPPAPPPPPPPQARVVKSATEQTQVRMSSYLLAFVFDVVFICLLARSLPAKLSVV